MFEVIDDGGDAPRSGAGEVVGGHRVVEDEFLEFFTTCEHMYGGALWRGSRGAAQGARDRGATPTNAVCDVDKKQGQESRDEEDRAP